MKLALLAIVVSACGGATLEPTLDAAVVTSSVQHAGACTWPAQYDPPDAFTGQCHAATYFLLCHAANSTEACLSDDPTKCPENETGDTYTGCVDLCGADEYAIACGSIASDVPLPTGCRALPSNPAGVSFGCCSCS